MSDIKHASAGRIKRFFKRMSPVRLRQGFSAASLVAISALALTPAFAYFPGKDGVGSITTANTVVNLYTSTTVAAAQNATTITVASATGITANDELMLYSAQGATINTPDSNLYGAVSALNNAGRYEMVSVVSVAANVITVQSGGSTNTCGGGLRNAYPIGAQVVRVPQYTSLTISGTGSITAQAWDGTTGGIVAVLVQNTASIGGAGVTVLGKGFRGGAIINNTATQATNWTYYVNNTQGASGGAEKGESIAGYQASYDSLNGRYGRGAPANGGGGGNAHNAAGGGGANGDSGVTWTGEGIPDISVATYSTAWDLDGTITHASISSGGGRGGYTFASSTNDPTTIAPGNAAWGGNNRRERGGLGGRPLTNDASIAGDRLFFGGGGGAGDENNGAGTAGGNGGGLVFIVADTISGAGTIDAGGAAALDNNGLGAGNDAPGGGGGGGSVVLIANTALSGVAVKSNGGKGGNQHITTAESEGAGGGGGGGYIAVSGGTPPSSTAAGGANGTSDSSGITQPKFPANGATQGSAGNATATAPAFTGVPICSSTFLKIAKTSNGPWTVGQTTPAPTFTLTETNTGGTGSSGTITVSDILPTGLSAPASFTSGSWNCTTAGQTVSCTNSTSLAAISGSSTISVPITIAASAVPSGTTASLTNNASVGGGGDPNNGGAPPTPGTCLAGDLHCASTTTTVSAKADLVVTKVASPVSTYVPGQSLNYTMTVTNNGPSNLTGVTVSDTVPATVTVSSWTCSVASGSADCDTTAAGTGASGSTNAISLPNVFLASGASISVAVTGTAQLSATGAITNSVTATPPTGTTCTTAPCAKTATVTNTNGGTQVLSIVKSATPSTFAIGQSGIYSLQVSNTGTTSTAGTITVSDTLPAGITTTATPSGSGWNCSTSTSTQVTCTTTTVLLPGANAPVINIPITVAAGTASSISNTGTVTGGGDASCPAASHCASTIVTGVNAPQITLSKSVQSSLIVGVANNYLITATNTGQATTLAGTISDTIPTGLTIGTLPGGCTASGQTVTCTLPAGILVGGNVVFTIPITPQASTSGTSVANTAVASGGGDPSCPAAAHCDGTTTNTVLAPQLKILKSASPSTFVVGQPATYTLTVTNTGTTATTAVSSISDVIPSGLTIGTLPSGCTNSGQTVTCTIATGLATGTPVSFAIPVIPQNSLNGLSVTNTGSITGGGDPGCATGTPLASLPARCQSLVTNPVSAPQLTIVKTASSSSFVVGVPASYTLTVSNTGSATTTASASITDVIPGGLTIGTLPSGCSATGQQVTCTIATGLTVGSTIAFVIPVTPTVAANGTTLSNTASVSGGGDPTCPTTANCTSTITTPVSAPQLKIVKTASAANFVVGVPASYTLQVSNIGTAATTAVSTISDTIPSTLTIGALPSGCTASGQTVTCTIAAPLATGAPVSFVIPVTPLPAASGTTLANTASVVGGGDASCPTNTANCQSTVNTPVNAPAVKVVKTASSANFVVGVPASYTLTVTNTGSAATTAITTVVDIVPSSLTIGTVPSGCTASGQTVTCTIATGLATGVPVSFVIPVTAQASANGTSVSNTATVSGGGDPTCPSAGNPNCTSTILTPVQSPQLQIVKTASASNFVVGVPASYTLTVTNIGTAATTATSTITDTIPGNLTIGTLPSGCTASGQTVTCTIATNLATGTPVAFVIPVTPQPSASGTTLSNTASVIGGGDASCPTNTTNCQSTVNTPVKAPALQVVKTASTSSFVVGTPASYSLTVTNIGSAATTAATTLSDSVPSSLSVGAAPAGCSITGQQVTCTVASGLAVGASVSFVIPVTPLAIANGTTVNNTATVSGGGDPTCPNVSNPNCTSTTGTPVNAPQLVILKTVSSNPLIVGVPGSYTLMVTNSGTAATTATSTVTDTIPSTLTIGTVPSGCTASGQTVTCTIAAPLGVNSPVSFVIPITPQAAASGTNLSNTGTVVGGGDPSCPGGANCASTIITPVVTKADLVVTKVASPVSTYVPGQSLNYTMTVTNNGPSNLTGVTVSDTVPATVTVSSWTCSVASGSADCDTTAAGTGASGSTNAISLPNVFLASGASISVAVTGTAQLSATGAITNSVTATPPTGTTCTTAPCAKTATVTNTNGGTQVLSIVKSATPSTFAIGQSGIYSLQVSNTGTTSTAGTITVSDTLPAGITTTATPSGSGWNCSTSTSTQVTCTTTTVLLPGANAPVINIPITVAAGTASSISNTGTVTGGGDASCPAASHCASTIVTGVNAPQITLSKSVQSSLIVGVANNYLITATNTGQATTLAGTISDTIPTGLTIGTLPGGCTASGQTVTCTLPAGILVGGNVVFTIPITPQASTSGTSVANTAVASGGGDPSCPAAAHCDGTTTNTVLAPQLKILKSASPSTFVVGQPATYTLTVTNTGTTATTAVSSISDVIPSGLTIGTLPSGCTNSGQTVTCTIATGLATGTPVSFAIPVIPQNSLNGLSVTNTGSITGGGDPGCATGTPLASLPARCQSLVTNPVSAPQLTIVKTASSSSFVVGVPASYTLTVSNTGSATTTASASITDVIPGGLTIGTLPSGCSATGQQVTCTIATGLTVGSTIAFVIPVTPTVAANGTTLSNTASVSGGGDPTCPTTANCTSTITTPVSAPQLKIVKTASAANFVVGVPASYTLQVSNIGTAATTAVSTISDTIPSTLTIGALPSGCTASGQTVTCTIAAPLATGAPVSFVIPVTPLPAASGTTLANTASVVGGGDASCPTNTANCQSTVNTPVNAPAVKVVKTASSANFVVGVPASYTLTVTNTGSAATTAITTVVDIVPSSLTIGTVPSGCTASGQTVTCTIATGLATGVPVSFVIPVTAQASANGTSVSNTATVSGGGDPTCPSAGNPNCTSTILTPVQSPQLQIVKTASASNFVVGVPASYTLTVTNIGTAATTATSTITDTIPGNLTIGTLPSGCTASGQTVTCTIATNLATGTPVAFVIPVTPQPSASGTTLSNTASVIGGGDASCPTNTTNCQSTVNTPVKAPALQVVKTASTSSFVVGTPASYSLTVTNIGSAATTAATTLSDSVPSSLSVGAAPAGCSITGQQVTCTVASGLAVGASVSFVIPVTPLAIANGTTVNNTATVSGGGDPTCPNVSNPNCTSTTGTPVNAPQLVILKTVSSNPLIVGVPGSYTLMVTNSGTAATTATSTVTDTIPSTLTIGTVPSGCTASGQTVTCTIAAPLGVNSPVSFVIPITPQAAASGTNLSNTGTVVGGGDPSCPGGANCASTIITPVVTKADLVVTKVASPVSTYVPGQSLNYTMTVTNNGPSNLTGVTVSDTVPATVTVSSWTCSVASGSADCDTTAAGTGASGSTNAISLPNVFLASGASISVAVTGTAQLSATGAITNSVTATPPTGTTCTTAPCAKTATVTNTNGGTQVLSIVKSATPSTFAIGQSGIYSLQVSNTGTTSTAGTITVSDTLPAGITTTATPSGSGWNCSTSTSTQVTCTTTTVLLPGANAPVINIPITVAAGTASSISNTGTVTGGGDASCPAASHCASTIVTGVNAPQITLSKSVQSSLIVGVANNYLITATNTGQATTLAGTISDTIPTGLTIGTLPGGCTASGQTVTCTLPAGILVGGNVVFTIPITPQASTSGTSVANTAVASGGGDPSCPAAAHCDGTTTNTVLAPQLKILKSASPSTFVVGQPATYTLTVTNTGTTATTAVSSISDVIPSGLTIGTLPSGCTNSGQTVTCTIATGLATGTPVSFAIPVIPQNSLNGLSVTNTGSITGGGDPGCATGTPLASLPARCQSLVTNPVSAPQLTIVKTASSSSFVVGVPASYTLTVSNTGSATTTASASITDVIPGGLTIGTLPSGCSATGQQVTCTIATGLTVGSTIAFVIPVTPTVAANGTTLSNTASVSGGGDPTCPTTANCTSTITTPVSAPQLKIVKTASAANFVVGVPASYTLQVSNIGTAATTAVSTISDTIPSTLTIGALPSGCTASGQTVTCTIAAPLATGAPVSFVIPVTPLPAASGTTLANTASVVGGGDASCPTNTANCQSTVNTPVNAPAVKVVKTASSANFVVGVPASYTLTVTNTGSAATTAITTVVDIVPSSLTIGTVPSGCTASGQTVTCTIATGLATGVPVSFVIPVTAQASANGTSVSNTATVSGGGDPTCPSAGNPNCTSTILTPVQSPQLQIVKTASASNFVVGVPASYTLTVTNIGTAATTATSTITDTIPGNLTIGTLPSGCTASGQTVTCTIATNLATGTPVAFVIPVTPQPSASGTTLSNTASVIGGGDASCPTNTTNCQSTVNTPVKAPALQVVKTASTSSFVVGTPASYSLTVTNIGSAATTAATTLSDSVPSSLSVGAAPAGCSITGQQVTCTVASGLAVGASVSFVIPVTPLAIANGTTVNNTATVSGGGDPTCPNVSNPNCTSTTGTPVNAPQLVILKTVSSNPLIVGVPGSYTLMVTNSGTAATTATSTVTDTIPSTLTIGTVPSGCTASGQTVTCTIAAPLGVNSPVSFVIPITPQAAASGTNLSNTGTVVGGGDPSCPGGANCASTIITPVNAPAVRVVKTASSNNFIVGVAASYTLTVTNVGNAATTAVTTVTDSVPAGLTIGTAPSGCSTSGQTVTCTIAAGLATNSPVSFVIPVTPQASSSGSSISNTALVSGGGDPTCPSQTNANCSSTVTTPVNAPQLQIVKTASSTNFVVGIPASYTLTVTNTGSVATTAISTITDIVPSTLTIGSVPSACNVSGQTVTCTIATGLAINTPVNFVIAVTPLPAANATILTNTANVSGGGDPSCPSQTNANCSSTVNTPVNAPQVRVIKTTSNSSFVVGTPASYTLTVNNIGSAVTTAVTTVTDNVPGNLTIGVVPSGCAASGQIVTCTIAAGLAINTPVSFVIPVTPLAAANGTSLANTATVIGGGDSTCPRQSNPNCSSTVITPVTQSQLTIVKTGPATAIAGQNIVYSITITNTGTAVANNAILSDPAPNGLTYVSVGAPCTALPCNLGTLNVGQSVTVTGLTFAITTGFRGSIVNIASVVSDQTTQTSSSVSTVVKLPQANPPTAVPVNTPWLLLIMGLMLGLGGMRSLRVIRR